MAADASLVLRLQQRDRVAWEELYTTFEPRLRRFAFSLSGNGHDADDLVSETFLRVLPALDRLDAAEVNLEAYLFTTTKNLFLKQAARTQRTEPVADVPEPLVPVPIEDDPERSTMLAAQQVEVRAANASLQPRQRLVLALCELEERSYAEIGELVGLNENAVAQLVYRARESLRTELRLLQVDPESLPEECRAFLPALSQYLDGRLREPRKSTTLAHLEGCERCQAALADMREAQRRYRIVFLPLAAPANETRERLERELEETGYWQGGGEGGAAARGRTSHKVVAAGVCAAVLCVAGGLGLAALLSDGGTSAAPGPATAAVSQPVVGTTTTSTAATTTTSVAQPAVATGPKTTTATTEPSPTVPQPTPAVKPKPKPAPPTTEPAAAPAVTEPKPLKPAPPVDVTAPVVKITKAPAATTAEPSASVAFTSSEPAVFACRLDGGPWQACQSPRLVQGLAVGTHALSVRGTDKAGNAGVAKASWKVVPPPDTTAPTVSITAGPSGQTVETSASFEFAGGEPGLTFSCSLDGSAAAACASPAAYGGLAVGSHTFVVRATDAAGNVGNSSRTWEVTAPLLPDLLVSSLRNNGVTVRNAGTAAAGPTLVVVVGVGTFSVSGLAPGQSVSFSWPCKAGTLKATVDPTNMVQESNEDNNTTTRVTSCLGFGG